MNLEYDEQVVGNLTNINNQLHEIGNTYGYQSDEYIVGLESALRVVTNLFRFPGRLTASDKLGFLSDSFMVVGTVFHQAERYVCKGCGLEEQHCKRVGIHEFDPSDQRKRVVAGQWSSHS
jgi:hypothetical protein